MTLWLCELGQLVTTKRPRRTATRQRQALRVYARYYLAAGPRRHPTQLYPFPRTEADTPLPGIGRNRQPYLGQDDRHIIRQTRKSENENDATD